MDTIVAISTAPASVGAIGIIRISGEDALLFARQIFIMADIDAVQPRYMYLGTVVAQDIHDTALMVYFPAPHSYTGEDIVEIQAHGGTELLNGVVSALVSLGARPAKNGEFTRRAFLNNKLSLADAEGVIAMINATSKAELNHAYRLMSGELTKAIVTHLSNLLTASANLEAILDYPEELTEDLTLPTLAKLINVEYQLTSLLESSKYRKTLKDGINIAIIGEPNAGKSSLINALSGYDTAIVTDIAGTTRDVLKENIVLDGIKCTFLDTAGIRNSDDTIEKIGIQKAVEASMGADLVLLILDLSTEVSTKEEELRALVIDKPHIIVGNKMDKKVVDKSADVFINAKKAENITALISLILQKFDTEKMKDSMVLTEERHIFAVRRALFAVKSAIENFDYVTIDCSIVDIKAAYSALAEITGDDVNEEIVDKIFSTFCVGK